MHDTFEINTEEARGYESILGWVKDSCLLSPATSHSVTVLIMSAETQRPTVIVKLWPSVIE